MRVPKNHQNAASQEFVTVSRNLNHKILLRINSVLF